MRRLQQIPGVGPLIAHALVMAVGDARRFDTARDCAAWIGLTPLTNNSAEKTRIGHISRQGDHSLRRLLVLGAADLMRRARVKPGQASAWVQGIMARRPFKVATVAQAARIGTHRLGDAALGRQLSGRGGASLMPVPRRLTYPDTDCARAVACGVKPGAAAGGRCARLDPARYGEASLGIGFGQGNNLLWQQHSGRTSRPYRARSKPHRRQFGQDQNQDTPFCHRALSTSQCWETWFALPIGASGLSRPHKQAGYMNAPDRYAVTAFAACLTGAVHT